MKALFSGVEKISFTLDAWTSPFQEEFLGVTAHWIDDATWQPRELVIGFHLIKGSHTSENLKDAFLAVLEEYGLVTKLFTITTDNASNMTKMAECLETYATDNG